jgi:hypothetical protein
MKRITAILAVAALIISARGQGFLNLNFESAQNLPGNPGNNGESIPITDALPDWTAYDGPNALAGIYYVSNNFPGISTAVELEGGSLALSGDYSVELFENGSISQTATVSEGDESLLFEATTPQDGLYVTLGGQTLSYTEISEDSSYNVYAANIPSDLDGQTETLIFGMQGSGETLLDDIQFMTVPEPSEYALIGLGTILFGLYRRRKPSIGGSLGRTP